MFLKINDYFPFMSGVLVSLKDIKSRRSNVIGFWRNIFICKDKFSVIIITFIADYYLRKRNALKRVCGVSKEILNDIIMH